MDFYGRVWDTCLYQRRRMAGMLDVIWKIQDLTSWYHVLRKSMVCLLSNHLSTMLEQESLKSASRFILLGVIESFVMTKMMKNATTIIFKGIRCMNGQSWSIPKPKSLPIISLSRFHLAVRVWWSSWEMNWVLWEWYTTVGSYLFHFSHEGARVAVRGASPLQLNSVAQGSAKARSTRYQEMIWMVLWESGQFVKPADWRRALEWSKQMMSKAVVALNES